MVGLVAGGIGVASLLTGALLLTAGGAEVENGLQRDVGDGFDTGTALVILGGASLGVGIGFTIGGATSRRVEERPATTGVLRVSPAGASAALLF